MSQKLDQLGSVIHVAVQRVITRGLNDPRVRGLISITKVEVAPDLSDAKVFVSILPAEHTELTMHGLRSAAKHIQGKISKDIVARRLPRLSFHLDESLKRQAEVDAALSRTRREADEWPQQNLETDRSAGPNGPRSQPTPQTGRYEEHTG